MTLNKNQDTDGNEIDFSDSDFIVGSQVSLSDTNTRKILDWNSSSGTLSLENKTAKAFRGLGRPRGPAGRADKSILAPWEAAGARWPRGQKHSGARGGRGPRAGAGFPGAGSQPRRY